MILDATTKKVQILLAAAVTTNQCSVIVDYVDFTTTTTTPGNQFSNTNSTTAVDIINAPAASTQRKVNMITVCNKDTEFVTATIRLNVSATTYNYTSGITLPPGATLQFTDTDGWSVFNTDGSTSSSSISSMVTDIQVFTTSGTWTKPTSATFTQVDLVGAGGGGGVSQYGAGVRGGAGGGGGSRKQFLFSTADLTSTVPITIPAGGTGHGGLASFGNYLYAYGGSGASVANPGAGGGGTSAGANSAASSVGGSAVVAGTAGDGVDYADARGGNGSALDVNTGGGASYWGGGGGGGAGWAAYYVDGGCYDPSYYGPATNGGPGGASFFGGGGGGSIGGNGSQQGGATGGAITANTGGWTANSTVTASSIKCGPGGAYGYDGQIPGGAGGGANTGTAKSGGRGQAWIISW